MALTGTHVAGDPGHDTDHNLIDTALGNRQPLDSDLTSIAAMDSTVAGMIATDGGGWVKKTYAQVKTALGLAKADVGLGNVDNTADASKPVSTAQATAIALKANKAGESGYTGTHDFTGATVVGVGAQILLLNAGATVPGGTAAGTIIFQKLA